MIDDNDVPKVPTTVEDMPPPPPKARSVLMDILDRARDESENETARLMQSMKAKESADRHRVEEEEQQKAAEARGRVEVERRKREDAMREYEERKVRKEVEAAAKVQQAQEVVTVVKAPPPKSKAPVYFGVAAAVVVIAALIFFLVPRGTPATMVLDRPLDTARPGMVLSTPVPFGAKSMEQVSGAPNPEKVVAVMRPAPYKASAPVAVRKGNGGAAKPKPLLNLTSGILGGKKVVK